MPVRAASVCRQISERADRRPFNRAVGERRIGEQRGDDRLKRQADAQLGDHVGLVGKIEVGLHGRGAKHHVEPARPHPRHVARHDAVAALGHHRGLGERPFRADAEGEEADPQRIGDGVGALQMRVEFARDLVDGRQRRAGKLELAARLERDRAAAGRVEQPDELAVVLDSSPSPGARACPPAARQSRAGLHREPASGPICRRGISRAPRRCETPPRACRPLPARRPNRRGT